MIGMGLKKMNGEMKEARDSIGRLEGTVSSWDSSGERKWRVIAHIGVPQFLIEFRLKKSASTRKNRNSGEVLLELLWDGGMMAVRRGSDRHGGFDPDEPAVWHNPGVDRVSCGRVVKWMPTRSIRGGFSATVSRREEASTGA
jgi:hypothetical protein